MLRFLLFIVLSGLAVIESDGMALPSTTFSVGKQILKPASPIEAVVSKMKTDVDAEHKAYMKSTNIAGQKLIVDDLYKKYVEAKRLYELGDIRYNKSHTNWTEENNNFERQKNLLTHIYEFVKIYQSSTDKNAYYRTHCICNSSLV